MRSKICTRSLDYALLNVSPPAVLARDTMLRIKLLPTGAHLVNA